MSSDTASASSSAAQGPNMTDATLPWWKEATCYQIWPRSFKDSNGDGDGDICGVIEKLDYVKSLGVDCIWLSPTYSSPLEDQGYDISDYNNINPCFGTLEDMKELIEQVHRRGMRIILDLVINHTSAEHAWFQESKASRNNAKQDWYIWRPGRYANGEPQPPNNWRAALVGGSAWEYAKERDEFHLHLFLPSQPDLNWESDSARHAVFESAVVFWLNLGVDGFRIDTANRFSKNILFPDAEIVGEGPWQDAGKHVMNGPRIHEFIKEMRAVMDQHTKDIMLVGELPDCEKEEVKQFVAADRKELSMVFDFAMIKMGGNDQPDTYAKHEIRNMVDRFQAIDKPGMGEFDLPAFKDSISKVQQLISETKGEAWGTVFAENHDQPRSLRRFSTDDMNYWPKSAKLLAMLLATLSGTLFLYQGQEIGMTNAPSSWREGDFRDVDAHKYIEDMKARRSGDFQHNKAQKHADGVNAKYTKQMEERGEKPMTTEAARKWMEENNLMSDYPDDAAWDDMVINGLHNVGRDNSRTLMQWDDSPNAGFTAEGVTPWIGVNDNHSFLNVAAEQEDPESALVFWMKMLKLRKQHKGAFIHGVFECHAQHNRHTFEYTKKSAGERVAFVALNFSDTEQPIDPLAPIFAGQEPHLLAANAEVPDMQAPLGAWEGRVYLL